MLIWAAIILYFVPAVVAACRGHARAGAIFTLNLLTGWTVLGWIAAFIWAFIDAGAPQKIKRTGLLITREDVHRPRLEAERKQRANDELWGRMSSEPEDKPWAFADAPRERQLLGLEPERPAAENENPQAPAAPSNGRRLTGLQGQVTVPAYHRASGRTGR